MAKTTSDLQKIIAANGYNNGSVIVNPNSLTIPSTVKKIDGDTTTDLAAMSGVLMERFNDYRYYTGDTSS